MVEQALENASDRSIGSEPDALAAASSPRDRPAEPRPEILFRRRVRLLDEVQEVWRFRELILTLAERDLRARYKQSVLGFAWALITPLTLMAVFTLVFTKFTKIDSHGVPYPLFAYVGLLPWTFFSNSVLTGGNSLVANLSIVNKVYCPRELFPISSMAVAIVDTLISTLVLGLLFLISGRAPKPEIFVAPVLIAVLLVLTVGAVLTVSVLLVYLRDLRHVLPLALQIVLFATPVAYGIDVIANTRTETILYSILNPLAPLIDGLRRIALYGTLPDWYAVGASACTATGLLVVGYFLFKRLEAGIADIA